MQKGRENKRNIANLQKVLAPGVRVWTYWPEAEDSKKIYPEGWYKGTVLSWKGSAISVKYKVSGN